MNQIKIISLVSAIFIVSLASAGGLLYSKTWNPDWNPFQPDAKKLTQKAIFKMWNLKAVKTNSNFEISQKDYKLTVNIIYNEDKINPQEIKVNSAFNINAVAGGVGEETYPLAGEVIKNGKDGYFKITTVPSFIEENQYLSYFGINISKIKNKWIQLSKDSILNTFSSIAGEEMDATDTIELNATIDENIEKSTDSYKKVVEFIKSGKLYIVKNKLADENINGTKTYHYTLALNVPEVKNFILDFSNNVSTSSIGSISSFTPLALLTSFPSATGRAKESRIIAAMSQLRTVAVYSYSENDTYKNYSCSINDAVSICKEVEKQTGAMPIIFTSQNEYCSFSPLIIEGYYYCTDSTGKANITNNPQINGYCNGKTFICPNQVEISQEAREKASKKEFSSSLDKFFEQIGEITADIWIGEKDELVYRFKVNKELSFNSYSESTTTINLMADINFSDFDKPLNIQAPSEFETLTSVFTPATPKIAFPVNNSEIHTIAPALLLDQSSLSVLGQNILFAFWEGEKKSIDKNEKDFLSWGTVSFYGDTKMGGPVGKIEWNHSYTFAMKSCRDKALTICSDWSEPVYVKISPGTGLFTESDGGKKYFTKGSVVYSKEASGILIDGEIVKDIPVMNDRCLYDFTGKPEDKNILLEYYKTGNLKNPVLLEQYRCPETCEDGTCVKPYLKIISPLAGEKLYPGKSKTIQWESKGIEQVNIFLLGYNQTNSLMPFNGSLNGYPIATGINSKLMYSSQPSYWWSIPNDVNYLTQYPCYKIKVETLDKKISAISPTCFKISSLQN